MITAPLLIIPVSLSLLSDKNEKDEVLLLF